MKIIRKIFALSLIGLAIVISVIGCNVEPVEAKVEREHFTAIDVDWVEGACILEMRDNETGVHYLMIDNKGLTVMYNADGTIKVD